MAHKRFSVVIFLSLSVQILYGQKILNGDFEDNTAGSTQYNLKNDEWTSYMNNCYAYAPGVELDIQGPGSTYGTAPSGKWFISLATPDNRPDGFTMKLSSPLIKGQQYELTWMQRADDCCGNNLDPLLIGVSNDENSFGTQIYISHPTKQVDFKKETLKFTCPATSLYISVQNKGDDRGWNFVDNFQLKQNDVDIFIAFSPIPDCYVVSNPNGIDEISITDADGKQLFDQKYSGEKDIEVDVRKFPGADNIITVKSKGKSSSTELEVNSDGVTK
ncbi:MAG TPA: hypothetical protein VL651_05775 [Bacteroidia bacterium]|nr:hypothetical protein [Bacteroidia bacterium]